MQLYYTVQEHQNIICTCTYSNTYINVPNIQYIHVRTYVIYFCMCKTSTVPTYTYSTCTVKGSKGTPLSVCTLGSFSIHVHLYIHTSTSTCIYTFVCVKLYLVTVQYMYMYRIKGQSLSVCTLGSFSLSFHYYYYSVTFVLWDVSSSFFSLSCFS